MGDFTIAEKQGHNASHKLKDTSSFSRHLVTASIRIPLMSRYATEPYHFGSTAKKISL
jgi:hypothetical protein